MAGQAPAHGPEEFFDGHDDALLIYGRVISMLNSLGQFEVRVTKSQIGLRRRRTFAFLWMPGKWLSHPDAEVVLSIATDHPIASSRFKEVVHPAKNTWMHHLEVRSPEDLDDEVLSWLAAAWERSS